MLAATARDMSSLRGMSYPDLGRDVLPADVWASRLKNSDRFTVGNDGSRDFPAVGSCFRHSRFSAHVVSPVTLLCAQPGFRDGTTEHRPHVHQTTVTVHENATVGSRTIDDGSRTCVISCSASSHLRAEGLIVKCRCGWQVGRGIAEGQRERNYQHDKLQCLVPVAPLTVRSVRCVTSGSSIAGGYHHA